MRKCPKCGRTFDDSWKICIHCSIALTDDLSIQETNPELRKKDETKGISLKRMIWSQTKEEALLVIKDVTLLLFALIGFRFIAGIMVLTPLLIFESVVTILLVALLRKFKSRIVAILLLLDIGLTSLLKIFMIALTGEQVTTLFMNFLIFVALISVTRATFIFHSPK